MKPILFVVIIYLIFGCNLKLDKSAKNNIINTKKSYFPFAIQWMKGSPLNTIIENTYNILGKIDVYAGEFYFGNNAVSTGHTIFSIKYANT